MAIPVQTASQIVAGGASNRPTSPAGQETILGAADHIDARVKAHAQRLWAEAGRKGSPADFLAQARALAARQDIPNEAESTG